MAYAENTTVAVEKSIGEIIGLIKKHGAERIAQAEEPGMMAIQFFLKDRMLRFRITMPNRETVKQVDRHRYRLSDAQKDKLVEQGSKQRARALLLVIKAKLESVESGVETFEEAFLANVVLPDGQTAGEWMVPQIQQSYAGGGMPGLLQLEGPK